MYLSGQRIKRTRLIQSELYVAAVEGSLSNVIGLPMERLGKLLSWLGSGVNPPHGSPLARALGFHELIESLGGRFPAPASSLLDNSIEVARSLDRQFPFVL